MLFLDLETTPNNTDHNKKYDCMFNPDGNSPIALVNLLERVKKTMVRVQISNKNVGIFGHFMNSGLCFDKLLEFFCNYFSLYKDFQDQFIQVGADKISNN